MPSSIRSPSSTNTVWSACVWLCAGIELPASRRVIPVIPPVDSTCWRIFDEMPEPIGDQARADVSSFVAYMRISPAGNGSILNGLPGDDLRSIDGNYAAGPVRRIGWLYRCCRAAVNEHDALHKFAHRPARHVQPFR